MGSAVWLKDLELVRDKLERWDGREAGGMYLPLVQADAGQKPAQHCNYPSIKNKEEKQSLSLLSLDYLCTHVGSAGRRPSDLWPQTSELDTQIWALKYPMHFLFYMQ